MSGTADLEAAALADEADEGDILRLVDTAGHLDLPGIPRQGDAPRDPVGVAARVMLERCCPNAARLRKAAITVVEVPTAAWLRPMSAAAEAWWRKHSVGDRERGPIIRRVSGERTERGIGEDEPTYAVVDGRGVLVLSQSPDTLLPRHLLRATDLRLQVLPQTAVS